MTGEARTPSGETGPLDGVTVLDASRVLVGPFCTMQLGDLGADVIKVERPETGDQTRHWHPPRYGDAEESAYYMSVNRNKRSITLDLQSTAGREVFRDLASEADVVVENFRVGAMEEWDLGYENFREDNPGLVYCGLSGYGEWGPDADRPAYDIIMQAEGGLLSITGAGDTQQPALGLHDDVVGGPVSVRPPLAVPREPAVDEPGVVLAEVLVAEVPLLHRADPEVLDDHVGLRGEVAEHLPTRRRLEVERDRALVPVDAHVVGRLLGVAVSGRVPVAGLVARLGALDLDNVGAEVAELHRAERSHEDARGVEDGHAVERSRLAARSPGFAGHTSAWREPEKKVRVAARPTRGAEVGGRPRSRRATAELASYRTTSVERSPIGSTSARASSPSSMTPAPGVPVLITSPGAKVVDSER
jgi:hypothetical protein